MKTERLDPDASIRESARRGLLEQALCHAALLCERVHFYGQSYGLLPRTSTADDPLGALCVSDEDVAVILAGFRRIAATDPAARAGLLPDPRRDALEASRAALRDALHAPDAQGCGLAELVLALELDMPAVEAFLVALAPEIDERFARIFGYLNNDATRHRPRLGQLQMALRPWFPGLAPRREATACERLVELGLLELADTTDEPLPMRAVSVPTHVVSLCLRGHVEASRGPARGWDRLHWPPVARATFRDQLRRALGTPRGRRRPIVVLEAPPGSGRASAVRATADELGLPVVMLDLTHADSEQTVARARERALQARVRSGVLVVRSEGALGRDAALLDELARQVARFELACVALMRPDELAELREQAPHIVRVEVPTLDAPSRRAIWRDALLGHELHLAPAALDDVTARYTLAPGRVLETVDELAARACWNHRRAIDADEVRGALTDIQTRHLQQHATPCRGGISLDALVLPERVRARIDALVGRVRHRYQVLDAWGFARGGAGSGHGVSALFSGPSGTGKTATAAAIAAALDIDLYVVDLSSIMSKWVGETERNLAALFDEAEASHCALLFDEADSLFGKRSTEMKSASDRFANSTVNFLLQRLERFGGLTILTTNLDKAIDEAFARRFAARVVFQKPDHDQRLELWQRLLPERVAFGRDVELDVLAEHFEMTGANIRNALMRAAFIAAAREAATPVLTQRDLVLAAADEYESLGRLVRDIDVARLQRTPEAETATESH